MPVDVAGHDLNSIFYEEYGIGEPLILIHGVGLDHTMWKHQVKELSKHYRVIVYDMVGHGKSAHPSGPYSLDLYVNQLSTLVSHLSIEKFHIVGFSMGGMIAQSFAMKNRDKLKTLVIMSAVANRTAKEREAILKRVEEVKQEGISSTIEAAIQRWFNVEYLQNHREEVAGIHTRLQTNNTESYLAAYTLFATADKELWPQMSLIDIPTLVITGENDIGSNPEMARQMHNAIKSSKLIIVPNIKHMLPFEGAELVNKEVHRFIEGHSI